MEIFLDENELIVESIRKASKISYSYQTDKFLVNEYHLDDLTSTYLVLLDNYCVCSFKSMEALVSAYTLNKQEYELTNFDISLINTYAPAYNFYS